MHDHFKPSYEPRIWISRQGRSIVIIERTDTRSIRTPLTDNPSVLNIEHTVAARAGIRASAFIDYLSIARYPQIIDELVILHIALIQPIITRYVEGGGTFTYTFEVISSAP